MLQATKVLVAACAAAALAGAAEAQIYISEICDGTLPGGEPKWVQVTNSSGADIPDLSIFSVQNINNGSATTSNDAIALAAVALPAGASYAFAYETASNTSCGGGVSCFEFVYGQAPDQFSGAFINGNDVVSLYLGLAVGTANGGPGDGSDAVLLDRYGEIGVDGVGTFWDYTDGWARRCTSAGNTTFTQSEWFFAGANSLEDPGGDDLVELALLQNDTTPFVTESCATAPLFYCTPKVSSAGCSNPITTSAPTVQPISGANDYDVIANNVQGLKNGLIFVGVSGPAAIPFGGGTLCVLPPNKRGPISNSGGSSSTSCDGTFTTRVNDGVLIPTGIDPGPGNSAWYQYWYRDPMNGAGLLGTALSDAVQLDFQ